MHLEFSDGSVFHLDSDPNPNRGKDGRFGFKAKTLSPLQSAKNRVSNLKSELKRMESSGRATPEMLERKRKSLSEAEDALKKIGASGAVDNHGVREEFRQAKEAHTAAKKEASAKNENLMVANEDPKGPQKRASAGEIKQLSGRPKYEAALPAVDELEANFRKEFSAVQAEARSLGYRIKAPQLSMQDGEPILKFEVDTPRDIRHPDENPYMTYNHPNYHTEKASAYRQKVYRVEDFVNNTFRELKDFSTKTGIDIDF